MLKLKSKKVIIRGVDRYDKDFPNNNKNINNNINNAIYTYTSK